MIGKYSAFIATMGLIALMAAPSRAQYPTPGPDGHVPLGIPVNPPGGGDSQQWARQRAQCQEIAYKIAAHQPVDPDTFMAMREVCASMGSPPPASPVPEVPPPANQTSIPMVTPPEVPSGSESPESLNTSSTVGPFRTPFAGGGGDACAQAQSVDLAAECLSKQVHGAICACD
jgi:hypothetical protein